MVFFDIFQMSVKNLYRRKGRTLLTVSGVVIGCCAIVIMVSLGIGMKEAQEKMLAQMGNLTRITVSPSPSVSKEKVNMDKEAVRRIRGISGIKSVVAREKLELGDLKLLAGEKNRYQRDYVTIIGISEQDFEQLGYTLLEGKFPDKKPLDVLAGQNFAYQFADSKRPVGKYMVDYWMDENAKSYFKPIGAEISIAQEKEKQQPEQSGQQAAGKKEDWKIIEKITVVGRLREDSDLYEDTSDGLVMRMKDAERLQKQLQKITGQKKSKEYSELYVYTDSIRSVETAENAIRQMGFQTSSMESIRKPMEKDARQKQMMLGGLGGISLIVAAIGIANTMIMSITERTREIGILKALGCFLGDIKKEFLLEAAVIGFIGGLIGVAVSCLVSYILNYVSQNVSFGSGAAESMVFAGGMEASGAISVSPPWLAAFALLFSVLIGVAAGYYPANKAVKISALEAMKA